MKLLAIMVGTALFTLLALSVWGSDMGSAVEVSLLK